MTILVLATTWLSFSTVHSSGRPDLPPPDCIDRVAKGCVCTVTNGSSGVLVTVTCDNANLTEIPDLKRIGHPVEFL